MEEQFDEFTQHKLKFAERGFEIVQLRPAQDKELLGDYLARYSPTWTIGIDRDGKTSLSLFDKQRGYHLIDRTGRLRFVDLVAEDLDAAIRMLIDE